MTSKTKPKQAPEPAGFTITAAPAGAPTFTAFDLFRIRDELANQIAPLIPSAIGLHRSQAADVAGRIAEELLITGVANPQTIAVLAAMRAIDEEDADEFGDETHVAVPEEDSDPETCREVSCRATSLEHDHGPDCTPGCMVCTPIGAKR